MINNTDFVQLSLELHMFFARIMKEHSLFIEMGFLGKETEFKKVANGFEQTFNEVINKAIDLSNGMTSSKVVNSKELVTDNTLAIESKTSELTGIFIDENTSRKAMQLRGGAVMVNEQLVREVDHMNNAVLISLEDLIRFKTDMLNKVSECKIFTANYPLLFVHMINEAKMYHRTLSKLQKRENITNEYLYEQEIFWNRQMKEHAEFIRGYLDPTEEELMAKADDIAKEYDKIITNYSNDPQKLTQISLQETINLKKFKEAGSDGILSCQIKSLIIPLLADHVLREANHFIRLMETNNQKDFTKDSMFIKATEFTKNTFYF